MKTIYTKEILSLLKCCVFTIILTSASITVHGQAVSTFDDLTLAADTFYNGSDLAGGFQSGDAFFVNKYDTAWNSSIGFAYSNMTDTTTGDYTNQYSAIAGKGYVGSSNYAVAYTNEVPAIIRLTGTAQNSTVKGAYFTNTTYATLTMRDGDQFGFSKKFGGPSGTDPDFFLLTIKGFSNGVIKADSINFYLADYRFADSTQDYILKTWEYVDFSPLGNVDSLSFTLTSSDMGAFGLNNPAYFAMDNFNSVAPVGISEKLIVSKLSVFPNPATENLIINLNGLNTGSIRISDNTGKEVFANSFTASEKLLLPVNNFFNGIYFVTVVTDKCIATNKFIKQ